MKTSKFSVILKNLERIVEKAEKVENRDERRKILPSPLELKYFKKLASRIVKLRGKLTAEEEKSWRIIARIERQALRAYEEGLKSIKV